MKIHLNRFLRRVRIHGGEFDTSARAMYRVRAKRSLITYEKAFSAQAEPRIVRGSTIERKQMSTKTTFKRVALVTVAALGLGLLSVAPSNAAVQADTMTLSASTASTTVGTAVTVNATVSFLQETSSDTMTVALSYAAAPAGITVGEVTINSPATAATTDLGTPTVDTATARTAKVSAATAASINKTLVITLTPTKAGTYVIKATPSLSSGTLVSVAQTWTVTVAAATVQAPSATNSKLYLSVSSTVCVEDRGSCVQGNVDARYSALFANNGAGYSMGGITAANLVDTKTIGVRSLGTMIGTGGWKLFGADTSTAAKRSPVTYTVTGPAYISLQTDGSSPYSTPTLGSITESKGVTVGTDPYDPGSLDGSFWLYSTGVGGVVKVTATMDGVILGTRSFSIIGDAKSYVFGTPTKSVVGVGASETASVAITGADSIGTSTGAASVYAFSSDTSVATVNSTQASTVVITGVKSGTATITVGNASTIATSTITKSLVIKVGAITAKTVALSMSPLAPQPGELVTLTVTATDASGNAVGDGSRNLFSSTGLTTSLAVQGATWTASAAVTLKGGIATYTFYAPTGTGKLTVTATEGASTDNVIAAGTAATITSSVDVTNAAVDAATVAAEAAEAAAQDATDAALDATTAAEAAGALAQEAVDLVTELSAEVTKLIAGVRASITYLTKLVMKLAAK